MNVIQFYNNEFIFLEFILTLSIWKLERSANFFVACSHNQRHLIEFFRATYEKLVTRAWDIIRKAIFVEKQSERRPKYENKIKTNRQIVNTKTESTYIVAIMIITKHSTA